MGFVKGGEKHGSMVLPRHPISSGEMTSKYFMAVEQHSVAKIQKSLQAFCPPPVLPLKRLEH
jgi:hypothetical protein